jgi:hypothetical protein
MPGAKSRTYQRPGFGPLNAWRVQVRFDAREVPSGGRRVRRRRTRSGRPLIAASKADQGHAAEVSGFQPFAQHTGTQYDRADRDQEGDQEQVDRPCARQDAKVDEIGKGGAEQAKAEDRAPGRKTEQRHAPGAPEP